MKIQIAYKSDGTESFSTRLVTEGIAEDYLSGIVLAAILCKQVESNHDKEDLRDMNVYFNQVYQNSLMSYLS